METTATPNIEKTTHDCFTIAKDFDKLTVLITKPSPRSRMGLKVVHHYSFRSTDLSKSIMRMNLFVDKFITEQETNAKAKQERKATLTNARANFKNPFSVGDILYESGGYEQTNVYFYQVIKVERKTLVLREVNQDRTDTGFMSGNAMPIKDSFASEKEIKKIIQIRVWSDNKPHIYVNDLSAWDGKPKYWSSYY
jgi:hypothetical protein